jgi:hypothetical protein
MNDNEKAKASKVLAGIPTEELNWVIGRFTGIHNEILCIKKFGCIITKEFVEQEILNRFNELLDETLSE